MRQLNLDESEATYQMLSTVGWAIFTESFKQTLESLEEEIETLNTIQVFLEREQYIGAKKHLRDFVARFEAEIREQIAQQRNKINEQPTARFGV